MPVEQTLSGLVSVLRELARELAPKALGRVLAGERCDPQREEGATWAGAFGEDYVDLDPGRTRGGLLRRVHAWQMMLDRPSSRPSRPSTAGACTCTTRLSTSPTTRRSRISTPPTAHCG